MCFPSRQRTNQTTPAPLFSAGVQAMRARICSAFSCAMFARVVWQKLWRAAKPPTFTLLFYRMYLPRMAFATNSCTRKKIFKREDSPL